MRVYHILYLLFILVYTQGAMERLGVPDVVLKLICEAPVLLLVSMMLLRSRTRLAPGWIFVLLFVVATIASGKDSGDGFYLSFLYFRMLLYAYIIFLVVWNTHLTRSEIFRLNRLILGLGILQIAASLYTIFILHQRVEAYVGTFESGGGGAATAFPLFAMAYVMAFYFYYKRSNWLILLGLSFAVVGFASGKRAIYYFIPLVYTAIILWYGLRERAFAKLGNMLAPVLIFALCIPFFIYGLTQTKRFTHLQGAKIDVIIYEALDIAYEYDNRVTAQGETFGRSATSMKLLSNLFSSQYTKYFWGFGPASMINTGGKRAGAEMGINYGVVGWVKDIISVGWLAMIAHISFYGLLWWRLYRRRSSMVSDYEKALHFACHLGFAVYFLLYFTYLDAFAMAGWFTFVHLYFVALVLSPKHQSALQGAAKT